MLRAAAGQENKLFTLFASAGKGSEANKVKGQGSAAPNKKAILPSVSSNKGSETGVKSTRLQVTWQ